VLSQAIANGTFAKQKAILIGEGRLLLGSRVLSDLLRYRYTPAAVFQVGAREASAIPAPEELADALKSAIVVAREQEIRDILVFVSWERSWCIEVILSAFSVLPARVCLVPDDKVVSYLKRTSHVGEICTAELKRAPLNRLERALKRAIDLLGAAAGLLLLAPFMLIVAVFIKLESTGPIFFAQWRSGFNGRSFRIFKFRTMTVLEDGPVVRQATREDPRVTRVGRWLRRTNIDELPQLLNVLRGEMSLVGPRPHATAHDSEYTRKVAGYISRYQLKPGMTGWAQFNGYRGETRTLDLMSKRIELDVWYIRNWSFWLDLKIIAGTVAKEMWRPHGY
jgi:Undecaprenyl-phosphate glucose phosphotransferase